MDSNGAAHRRRVMHVHPTRRCNLACAHCYSWSGPEHSESQSASVLSRAIREAARLGYQIVSFSGGEPLLFRELPELLEVARVSGLHTSVVTNGTRSTSELWRRSLPLIDTLVLSVDGPPDMHNAVRRSPNAFRQLTQAVDDLHRSGMRFSLIHTLCKQSWSHIDWLHTFATDAGAQLLQLHPIEISGRAKELLDHGSPAMTALDSLDLMQVYLYAQLSVTTEASMRLHADVSHVDVLENCPEQFYDAYGEDRSALPNPLVIEETGILSPMSYGIDRALACGDLRERTLLDLMQDDGALWRMRLQRHCEQTRKRLLDVAEDSPIFNWYEALGTPRAPD
jgi:MoaA/NifB/PqqE/SkfB family radical SAM enzyme